MRAEVLTHETFMCAHGPLSWTRDNDRRINASQKLDYCRYAHDKECCRPVFTLAWPGISFPLGNI